MRKDCAAEALETEGWCPNEGKGRGGAKGAHTDAPPTRSSSRSLEYRIIEMWVRLLESDNSRPWCPGETHGTSSYAPGPGLHFVLLFSSIGTH